MHPPGLERAPELIRRDERMKRRFLGLVNLAIINEIDRDALFMVADRKWKVPFEKKQDIFVAWSKLGPTN
jgi:orotate phosphoribosyltransferase-like protein